MRAREIKKKTEKDRKREFSGSIIKVGKEVCRIWSLHNFIMKTEGKVENGRLKR